MNAPCPSAAPVRQGNELARFEAIDRVFADWAREWSAEEFQFPALIDGATLARAEYPAAFPHLLLGACGCADPARPLARLLEADNLKPSGWLLSPAVCYHVYSQWEGLVLTQPRIATARGRCFRSEAEFAPGRRQIEFEMREIILCGAPDWADAQAAAARTRIDTIAATHQLAGNWETAADPFFLPTAQGKAHMQRLQETKKEFVVRNPTPLALASINRHGTFFGERFHVSLPDGTPAHTACIAFGLDRWASAIRRGWETQPAAVQAIRNRLRQVMPAIIGSLAPDAPLTACSGDSIDFVELLCAIDADYGVRLTTDELATLASVADLLALVDRRAVRRPSALSP